VPDAEEVGNTDADPAGPREDGDIGGRPATVALVEEELAVLLGDSPSQPALRLGHARLIRRLWGGEELDLEHVVCRSSLKGTTAQAAARAG
jgi:hypothetical protein